MAQYICNTLTPEPGFHGDPWLPQQPTQLDNGWGNFRHHMKQVNTFVCRSKEKKKWGHFTGKLEKRLRQKWEFYRGGCRGTKDLRDKTIFCSTAPVNSDIYKLFVVYVSRGRVTRGARITEKTLKTYIKKHTALHYIHCEWMDELQRLMTIWLNLLRGTISSPLSFNLSDYRSTWYDSINSIQRCINDIISDCRIIGQFHPAASSVKTRQSVKSVYLSAQTAHRRK